MANDNFSNYLINNTKQLIYYDITEIIDILTKLYNSTYDIFSFVKQLEFEQLDNRQSNTCWEILTRMKENRDVIDSNLDEFIVVMDSYLNLEDDIDGYFSHRLNEVCDNLSLIENDICKL